MKHKTQPTLTITAYTGGPLKLPAFVEPVVIDLAGLRIRGSVPILREHKTNRIVGHTVNVGVIDNKLQARGIVSGHNGDAREIVNLGPDFPWQASLGAKLQTATFVDKGEQVTVNGRTFKGPVLIARRSVLKEISLVLTGSDEETSATVTAA